LEVPINVNADMKYMLKNALLLYHYQVYGCWGFRWIWASVV